MNKMKEYNHFYDTLTFTKEQKAQIAAQAAKKASFKPRKRAFTFAATLSIVFALGLTACAVNLFGIRDMLMNISGRTYVTIAGYQNSNEYQALMEWEAQCPKKQSLKGPVPEEPLYHQYGAYTHQAKKLLDSILEKYGLAPYSQWISVYDRNPQSLYDAVGAEGFLPESCSTTDLDFPGCSVRSGGTILSFSDSTLLSDIIWVDYEFTNSAKGYMPIFMGMEIDPDTAYEWWYKTADGTSVLLCTDYNSSIILADLPNSFLWIGASARAEDSNDNIPLSKEELQAFADLFSYKEISKLS